jgi:hypothetical protein
VVAFRNPAIVLKDEALVYYGIAIPWSAISGTYFVTSNLTMVAHGEESARFPEDRLWLEIKDQNRFRLPGLSRRIMYYLARLDLRISGGFLPLPLVKECSVEELAEEVEQRTRKLTPYESVAIQTLYCPKCGDSMSVADGTLKCERGDMALSERLCEDFLDVYVRRTKTSSERPLSFKAGGSWYCPENGRPLVEKNGMIRCDQCGNALNQFIYQLIEVHPHK